MPLIHLLRTVEQLLWCWHVLVERVPAFLQVVACTLLPLVQQLQGCGSLLMRPAAATARTSPAASVQAGSSSSSSSSSCEQELQIVLIGVQQAVSMLLIEIDAHKQLDAGVAADVLRLQIDPAVVEMQLQLLTAWTAQLHEQHTAQQQQQLPAGAAATASSSTSQQLQQLAKQQHRADLLSIPAFHQDMLQLLPGGQAYLDAAAEESAGWGLTGEAHALQLRNYAGSCCHTINHYLYSHLPSFAGQQQISRDALVVSGAAVRLVLELQLLASGAVQRQREQQQQRQQELSPEDQATTDTLALQAWDLLNMQTRALVYTSRSCLPPEVLQQAGLQLLQALAAPLQQWQLCRSGDSFLECAAEGGALSRLGEALLALVTAACGAYPIHDPAPVGEHDQWFSSVCFPPPQLVRLCIQHCIQPA
jgi:hypothetical protein